MSELRSGDVSLASSAHQVVALAELTGHLVTGTETTTLLYALAERTRSVIDAAAVSVVLTDQSGDHAQLDVVASSARSDADRSLAVGGPVEMCVRIGAAVLVDDLSIDTVRWRDYTASAIAAGYAGMRVYPVRVGTRTAGAVVVHTRRAWDMPAHVGTFVQAVADLAGLSLDRAATEPARLEVAADRRRSLLDDNMVIEQAIGVLSERRNIGVAHATVLLVAEARGLRRSIVEHARWVVED